MTTNKIASVDNFKKVAKEGAFLAFLPMLERTSEDPVQALRERVVLQAWHAAVGAKSNGVAFVNAEHDLNGFSQRDVRVATSMMLWLLNDDGREFLNKLYNGQDGGAPHWGSRSKTEGLNQMIVPQCYAPNDADQKAIDRMAVWLVSDTGLKFTGAVQKTLMQMGQSLAVPYRV